MITTVLPDTGFHERNVPLDGFGAEEGPTQVLPPVVKFVLVLKAQAVFWPAM
jgi:hypothetical protein